MRVRAKAKASIMVRVRVRVTYPSVEQAVPHQPWGLRWT
jgi:hypothetical protein